MTKTQLKHLETRLLEERARVMKELGYYGESFSSTEQSSDGDLSSYSFHMADQGSDTMEKEKNVFLASSKGNELYEINKSLAHVHKTFEIKKGGTVVATIQQALMSMFGQKFTITAANGDQLKVTGNWRAREFHIQQNGADVIQVSRKYFSMHGSYGIQIRPGFDVPMVYGELYLPWLLEGTNIRFGRYISLPDIEAQLAPNNYMYSHSMTSNSKWSGLGWNFLFS